MGRLLFTFLLAAWAHLGITGSGLAQDSSDNDPAPQAEDPNAALAQRRFSEFAKQAEDLHLFAQRGESKLRLHEQPLQAVELAYKDQPVWTADEFMERNLPRQTGPYITTLTEPAP